MVKKDLAAPAAHPKELLLAAASLLIAIFILAVAIRLIINKRQRGVPAKIPGWPVASIDLTKKTRSYITLYIILAIVFTLIIAFGLNQTSQPSFCAACHKMKPYVTSWKKSRHKNVGCLNCHQQAGVFGYFTAKAAIFRDISLDRIYFARTTPIISDPISNNNCKRCHQKIADLSLNGVKISHKRIADNNYSCVNCHAKTGHALSTRPKMRLMSQCLTCHNGLTAPDNCDYCHKKDIGYQKNQLSDFGRTDLFRKGCSSCHPLPDCKSCHKTRHMKKLLRNWE